MPENCSHVILSTCSFVLDRQLSSPSLRTSFKKAHSKPDRYFCHTKSSAANESAHVPIDDVQVDERLSYEERPIAVLERKTKSLGNKDIGLVKVQWEHHKRSEWT
ncbi:hypothetical protein OSB04_012296 [Centaurea solstitialis]|uniref:Chromo domain-containing protein n=1 Tax=Centaurea solstitialis TaxID=347529 RepID=A0AA38TU65_9ASTR|nr:hypothetical protein OSB04_012296 [Centaurea solstitialis]